MSIVASLVGILNGTASTVLTSYVAAVVILLVGFIAARLVGILSRTILHSLKLNKFIKETVGLRLSIEEILPTFFVYFIYFLTIVMALNQIGITTRLVHGFAIAIIVIIIISVVIALKDFVPNIIAGFYMLHFWHLKVGDKIEFENTKGKVVEISLLDTMLKTAEKDTLIIPNTTMYKKIVKINR